MCNKFRQKGHKVNVHIKNKDGIACLQQGISKLLMGRGGKLLKCFHYNKNHKIDDCPDIDDAKKKEIKDAKKKHWEERRLKEAAEKAKKTVPGQSYLQITESKHDGDSQADHQDKGGDIHFAFMQNEVEDNLMLKE